MLLNMPGQRLQLAAIQMEQPPAALAYHVRVQVAVGVVTDILIAGGSSFGREKAAHLSGGGQSLQMAVNGGFAYFFLLQNG